MITDSLGIKGWPMMLDRMLTVAIITGDPILMISKYGQGKTALVDRLGYVIVNGLEKLYPQEELLAVVLNASTANPQDWAGYLIPPKEILDSNQKMNLVLSPKSLINAVLIAIDEISRAESRNQNNILSLIQERRVDGYNTKCEYLFAMMNPVMADEIDEGSEPLIAPVADRFALLVEPPEFGEMGAEKRKEVILSASTPNNIQNVFAGNDKKLGDNRYVVSDNIVESLWKFFGEVKSIFNNIFAKDKKIVGAVADYVDLFAMTLKENKECKYYISGRRTGMMVRSIIANYAVGIAYGRGDLQAAALEVVHCSMMNKAMGITHNPNVVMSAHAVAVKYLASGSTLLMTIMNEPDKWKRLKMAIEGKLKPDEFTRLYKDVINMYDDSTYADEIIGFALFNYLEKKISKHELSMIGMKIMQICADPITEIGLPLTGDSIKIITTKNDQRRNNIAILSRYISEHDGGLVTDVWDRVANVYDMAVSIIKSKDRSQNA